MIWLGIPRTRSSDYRSINSNPPSGLIVLSPMKFTGCEMCIDLSLCPKSRFPFPTFTNKSTSSQWSQYVSMLLFVQKCWRLFRLYKIINKQMCDVCTSEQMSISGTDISLQSGMTIVYALFYLRLLPRECIVWNNLPLGLIVSGLIH